MHLSQHLRANNTGSDTIYTANFDPIKSHDVIKALMMVRCLPSVIRLTAASTAKESLDLKERDSSTLVTIAIWHPSARELGNSAADSSVCPGHMVAGCVYWLLMQCRQIPQVGWMQQVHHISLCQFRFPTWISSESGLHANNYRNTYWDVEHNQHQHEL